MKPTGKQAGKVASATPAPDPLAFTEKELAALERVGKFTERDLIMGPVHPPPPPPPSIQQQIEKAQKDLDEAIQLLQSNEEMLHRQRTEFKNDWRSRRAQVGVCCCTTELTSLPAFLPPAWPMLGSFPFRASTQ